MLLYSDRGHRSRNASVPVATGSRQSGSGPPIRHPIACPLSSVPAIARPLHASPRTADRPAGCKARVMATPFVRRLGEALPSAPGDRPSDRFRHDKTGGKPPGKTDRCNHDQRVQGARTHRQSSGHESGKSHQLPSGIAMTHADGKHPVPSDLEFRNPGGLPPVRSLQTAPFSGEKTGRLLKPISAMKDRSFPTRPAAPPVAANNHYSDPDQTTTDQAEQVGHRLLGDDCQDQLGDSDGEISTMTAPAPVRPNGRFAPRPGNATPYSWLRASSRSDATASTTPVRKASGRTGNQPHSRVPCNRSSPTSA
jgi:hypothetical protein